ncbi:xanthine dehydrogenase family protein molybdopterin-binding subunit [Bradyrhizobium sp. CCGUVB1N3]|uniref:xanthine dehydrogenase family protein molybdopterin-binding subunit n=1 Tax=Bradyrhizobium sp. CCGUVB1N3 TaxID=2949629 RepID=UPI0020B2F1F9|nr:xanthine dehydrogenase family protein molybdopterin-binding subunit [Bradyrhizobium sp. CCGUVB1N3]MCP3476737.1 xanthine dehydrogenase family protein molybdopterin-binding subunit [Bradyrhizobium sp. CCGUVB1N3]
MSAIGKSLKRLEDKPLLLGQGRFAADYQFDRQLIMRVVRSPVAFGRILSIDAEDARAMPGVVAIWTAADVADIPLIDFRMTRIKGLEPYRQPVLARDYVRYVGEPVALVFAEDVYQAEDAADLVFCDIDEGVVHLDATAPPVEFMPETLPGVLSEPAVITKAYGELDQAFAKASHVVELEVAVGRHTGVPMETRGALAVHDPNTGVLTMYGAAKVPHYNRDAIGRMLGLEKGAIELSEGHVGGGFGIRGELYPEDVLVCAAALRLGRPVKWIEDRREHLLAANHSRDQVHRLRAAVDDRGFVLGLEDEFFTDQGAYVRTHGGTVSDLAAALLPGPYLIPAYRVNGHIRLTNKTPSGTYRAPGRYESTFARERLMDVIAHRLGLDAVEVRRVNLIPEDRMPYDRKIDALGTEVVYDAGKYHDLLDKTLAHVGYDQLRAEAADRRSKGEHVGIGVALFIEKSGLGPRDLVRARLLKDGSIEIITGVASIGQGVETIVAQICAEVLSVEIEQICVVHGQTSRIEVGLGAFASRVTVMTGSAAQIASRALRDKILAAAATLLRKDSAEDLTLVDGMVRLRDSNTTLQLREIADQTPDIIEAEGWFHADHMNYPYGVHVAKVHVDDQTWGVKIERYVVGYEVGRAINPVLVHGQIAGAAVQGIGGALLEEFVYDESGQPLATSFADYLMPTSNETCQIEMFLREDCPSPQNPLGVRGAGEGGLTAVGAAIGAAVDDALQSPGLVDCLPIGPSKLHAMVHQYSRNRD